MLNFLPYLIAALIYLTIAMFYWRRTDVSPMWLQVVLGLALATHGWLLHNSLLAPEGLNLGLTNALSAILWLTVLIYWSTNFRQDLHRLQAFILPPAACALLLQWAFPENHLVIYEEPIFRLHLIIALSSYSLLTFAALHALLMTIAERTLHRKPTLLKLPDFPPLINMERLLFQMVGAGFFLLTLTLISGTVFSEQLFNQAFRFNHKTVFAFCSWLIFAALLIGRWRYGWRGRLAVRLTLFGFITLLLAYIGTKFVLEYLLTR